MAAWVGNVVAHPPAAVGIEEREFDARDFEPQRRAARWRRQGRGPGGAARRTRAGGRLWRPKGTGDDQSRAARTRPRARPARLLCPSDRSDDQRYDAAHLAARGAIPSDYRRADPYRFPAGRGGRAGDGHGAGRLLQSGPRARAAPRRHLEHRAPRDRDDRFGRQHSRADQRRPRRAGDRRQHSHQPGSDPRRRPTGRPRARLHDRDDRRLLGGARGSGCRRRSGRRSGGRAARASGRRAARRAGRPSRSRAGCRSWSRAGRRPRIRALVLSLARAMRLIVGLGNPGPRYARNRHNIGFMVADAIARRYGFPTFRDRFKGELSEGVIAGARRLLLKPQTFMNDSGEAVLAAMSFYKIAPEDIVVIHDELDLRPGKVRVKRGGGNAGHNGLRSIDAMIGSDFWRVRIGIGHPGIKELVQPYVLMNFPAEELRLWVEPLADAIAESLPWLLDGAPDAFMSEVARR